MFKKNRLLAYIVFTAAFLTGFFHQKCFSQNQEKKPETKLAENFSLITGKVKDAVTGLGIPGANISIPEVSAAITDENGIFSIETPSNHYSLFVSAAGYGRKQVFVKGKESIEVSLYQDGYSVVYGKVMLPHGETLKELVPYSVTSVNTEGAWDSANETVDSYMQGRVAGVESLRKSGSPDIGANLYLRGYSSLYANNQPLVIVDGMLFDTKSYGTSLVNGYENNPLSTIDIKDIDNITVIKDAVSTYGTKGANGVILITTAKAKDVATRLNFGAYGGYNIAGESTPVLGPDEYRTYLSDILRSKGLTNQEINELPYFSSQQTPGYYNYHQNTDWQNLVKDNAASQNYYLKVTGGDDIATYALSLGYLTNKGSVVGTNLNRYQTRFNADLNLTQKLKGQINLSFSRNERDLNHQGLDSRLSPVYTALVKAPFLSPYIVNENNISSPNLSYADDFGISNPEAIVSDNMINKINGYRFMGGLSLNYEFNKKFRLNTLFGLTFDKGRENLFVPEVGIAPVTLQVADGYNEASASVQRFFSIYTDTYLSYRQSFTGNHKIQANIGFRYNNNKTEYDTALAYNTASDDFVTLNAGQSTLRTIGGSLGKWNWLNTYANLNYVAKDKYFITFNLAADASSRFGREIGNTLTINKVNYAFLPSVAAAWLMSAEDFMANNSFVESLKLRTSYGLVGNDDIGNYTSTSYYVSQNFLGRQGLLRGNIANPEIKWETNAKFNLGLEASFFTERLNLSLDYYNHNIKDLVVYQPVPDATGFSYVITNAGAMTNSGIELGINSRLINQKNLKWDFGVTIAKNKNEITRLPQNEIISNYNGAVILSRVGQSANLFYGYKTNGIYRSDQEANSSGVQNKIDTEYFPVAGGDVRFIDVDGNKIIDLDDRQIIGDPNPDFLGSFFTKVDYKRWTLNSLFTFSVGNDVYNAVRAGIESMDGYNNQSIVTMNRWRTDGHVTDIPRATWGDPLMNSRFSDRWIEDGSYLRLRTISLSYNIPLKSNIVRNASIYAIATNLFTMTNYLGYDPEFSANTSIFSRGVDIGLNPQYKSVQLGLRIGL